MMVKRNGQRLCEPTFEVTRADVNLQMVYTSDNGLNNEVSRIEATSAMIANNGALNSTIPPAQMCADVNINDNSVQIFGCHMGANQSWTYNLNGTITGFNGLCLKANPADVTSWPTLGGRSNADCKGPGIRLRWAIPGLVGRTCRERQHPNVRQHVPGHAIRWEFAEHCG